VSKQIYVRATTYSLNCHEGAMLSTMLGETEKSSDVCKTASLSEIGHE